MNKQWLQKVRIIAATALLAGFGCQHIGPKTIVDDRLGYNRAVLKSWEEQTLLNIVRARYRELVSFVDVGSVTQTHSVSGTAGASLSATLNPWNIVTSTLAPGLSGSGTTSDSPTITYTPLTGAEFARNLNAPLRPSEIFNLIESGYRPQLLLNMTLYSINDITSAYPGINLNYARTTSSDFINLTRAIECAHARGDVNFPVQPGADAKGDKVFMVIADKDSSEASCDKRHPNYPPRPVAFIRQMLRLKSAETKFEIVAGFRPRNDNEIAVRTRPVIGAMIWLSNYIEDEDAPNAPHIASGPVEGKGLSEENRPLNVRSNVKKPDPRDVFVAVEYRDYWFWIPKNHEYSKSSLIYLRILLALADTGPKPAPPALTIPVR